MLNTPSNTNVDRANFSSAEKHASTGGKIEMLQNQIMDVAGAGRETHVLASSCLDVLGGRTTALEEEMKTLKTLVQQLPSMAAPPTSPVSNGKPVHERPMPGSGNPRDRTMQKTIDHEVPRLIPLGEVGCNKVKVLNGNEFELPLGATYFADNFIFQLDKTLAPGMVTPPIHSPIRNGPRSLVVAAADRLPSL